jgi:hypothetical protein
MPAIASPPASPRLVQPSKPAFPVDCLLDAIRAGHRTLLHSGRSLRDKHADTEKGIEPLLSALVRNVWEEFGMGTISFNLALGGRWCWEGVAEHAGEAFERRFSSTNDPLGAGIAAAADHTRPPYERAYYLLGGVYRSLVSGRDLPPLMLLIEFGEDLTPDQERGGASDTVIQIAELLQLIASDTRRDQQLVVLVSGKPERMDRRVLDCLHPVCMRQPDRTEKDHFIQALRRSPFHREARLEPGLDDAVVANLTARTPNLSLEAAYFESARTGRPIGHHQLVERKRADVVALSEGTLNLLDTERVESIRLAGRNVERPLELVRLWAEGIKRGDPRTPTNVILCGAPSTAKTDLALLIARLSQTPVYSMLSPKGSFVGQTEARVRLLFRTFKEMSPAIGVIDEITEAFPTERNTMNLDSGATQSVVAEMLNALSDSSRAGRTLLVATTNCPWKVGDAMASRFLFVPVLSALEDDYPEILCSIATNLLPEEDWNSADPRLVRAANEFHRKGASPRVMRSLLSSKIATASKVQGNELLIRAANACAPQDPRSRASSEFADLFAIRKCSDLEMLPWHGRFATYPMPGYLRNVVTGDLEIDHDALDFRLKELEAIANV